MSTLADILWYVNNEYRKHLSQVHNYLTLLEQMLHAEATAPHEGHDAAVQYLREQVERLMSDHQAWRYHYYYESNEQKRMVQSEPKIQAALTHFNRMRHHHEFSLRDLDNVLHATPRPDERMTSVPGGDLWQMVEDAFSNLFEFTNYLRDMDYAT